VAFLTRRSRERLRARYEAWDAQINQFLELLPERRKRSPRLRELMAEHGEVRDSIAAWTGSRREVRELERSWRRLRRAWEDLLEYEEVTS
jgi:uncharacterized coiled-coil DUF342 family protein